MPKLVILLGADVLIHASVFCCGNARAFMVLPKKTFITLHGKLNKLRRYNLFFAATLCDLVQQWFE
ncbi:MAG: hypothetical protein WC856_22795 [Methylococcaceae bacterium]|jgi:hypothetical protein